MKNDSSHLRLYSPWDPAEADVESPAATAARRPQHGTEPATHLPGGPAASQDLEIVLSAWHTATEKLQRTHEVLCGEVRRLSHELEIKNRELLHKNRLADLGQMASHVAHEVRNALAPVTLYLSLLRRHLKDDADGKRMLDKLEGGFRSLEATVHDMLSFTADREPAWRRFELRDLVAEVCESMAPQFQAQSLRVSLDVAPGLAVWGDKDMLRRALVNLVLNAVDAMPAGGEIYITGTPCHQGFELEVADTGPGIPDDAAEHLFEPFFTTKSDGAGLGLAIVYRIAEAHGGKVRAANCPDGGAAFTLHIPHQRRQEAA